MKLLRRMAATEDSVREKAFNRVDRLSTSEVLDWTDAAGNEVVWNLQEFRRRGDRESLQGARQAVLAILGCLDSLEKRAE